MKSLLVSAQLAARSWLQRRPRSAGRARGSAERVPRSEQEAYERKVVQQSEAQKRIDLNPYGKTRYMNMGYWGDGVETYDDAGQAMAMLVGEGGRFSPTDHILDVGFGLGDQDFFWIERFAPERIVGIDISSSQVASARERAAERGLSDRIDFRVGSATSMPFADERFDKVVALEAAHEFMTREDFFGEAFRVLRPGGRLVTTDIIPLPGRKVRHFTVNELNMYGRDLYGQKLTETGFTNVAVSSIRAHVLQPFISYLSRLPHTRHLRGRINMVIRRFMSTRLDYVLATADKPPAGSMSG